MNGILYFHRISDIRVGSASKRNFVMFKKLCGGDAFTNVAIVTTRWDQEIKEIANKRLGDLKSNPQLFKTVIDGGAEIFKHDYGSEESGRKIIRHLINKAPKALLIQREMAEGKCVLKTSAGQELQREIMEQVEKHEIKMTELLEEMEQSRDDAEIEELDEEYRFLQDKMELLQAESQKLAEISNTSERELPDSGEISRAASGTPLNSARASEEGEDMPSVVATVLPTSEEPGGLGTKDTVPGESGRLEAEIEEIKELPVTVIGRQSEESKREGDVSLDEVAKFLGEKMMAEMQRFLGRIERRVKQR